MHKLLGTHQSVEHKRKRCESLALAMKRPEVKEKLSLAKKGKSCWWLKGKRRPPFSKEWRKKMSLARKGRKLSEETKLKMSKSRTGSGNAMYGKCKELCPAWKGGLSYEPYTVDWTKTLKQSIRELDKYTCKVCGEKQGDIAFLIHHIDYDKKNCNPSNLITVCRSCHSKTNYNREYWKEFFNNIKR